MYENQLFVIRIFMVMILSITTFLTSQRVKGVFYINDVKLDWNFLIIFVGGILTGLFI